MLVVGIGTFFYYCRDAGRPEGGTTAHRHVNSNDGLASKEAPEKSFAQTKRENSVPRDTGEASQPPENEPDGKEFVLPPEDPFEKVGPTKPAPRRASDPVLASGAKELPGRLERIDLPLPTLFKLHELDQSTAARQLREKLSAPGAYRIELLSRDPSKSVPRVRAAFAANKIGLVVDSVARTRLRKPLSRYEFAVFTENVTPDQVLGLLARLGVVDRTPPANAKSPEPRFEGSVVVQPWSSLDRQELATLIRANPAPVPLRPGPRAPDIDIHKPLPEVTEADVLQGKGVPRPAAGDHDAILLSLSGSRTDSPEVKRFLAARKPLQTGTIQVFIVLRHVGS
jgi:hypothetical protein